MFGQRIQLQFHKSLFPNQFGATRIMTWLLFSSILFHGNVSYGAATQPLTGKEDIRRDAVVIAVEKVMPAVVNIQTKTIVHTRGFYEDLFQEFYGPFFRGRPAEEQYNLGSGIIIDEAGYILTNFHVIQRANQIRVKLADGRVYEAQPIGGKSFKDIALLKLISKPGEHFPWVRFAPEDDLYLGETVLALGIPFGLGGSVSRGILSSKSRRPPSNNEPLDIADWLQTDAAINPGNSGGPLINLRGEIIGINVAVYREGQGIGFAVPIKRVNEALAEIFTPEELKGLWFGGGLKSTGNTLNLTNVQPGSPAAKAGLQTGDRLLSVNNKPVIGLIDCVQELLNSSNPGPISLAYLRGNDRKSTQIKLIPLKDFFTPELIRQKTGLSLETLTPKLASQWGLSTTQGLLVTSVENDSPATRASLQRGLIIAAIGDQPVNDTVTAARILYSKKRGETVELSLIVEKSIRRFNLIEKSVGVAEIKIR